MSDYTSEIQHIYRIGYVTAHKERDYDPLGNEEVCNYIEQFNKTYTESELQEKLRQQREAQAWKRYPDEKPEDRQNVAFVVRSTREKHLDGRILGGFYSAESGTFSVPGSGYDAHYWRPMFEPPAND